ncbi:MAG: 2-amino-4-hydroxy-6-hydroxymethyldihydropteridine diphosphokinase [Alcanivoracaceae bacterium]|nr:2-amino-4-hydroxy-6-hydroxymethyldihydropteridine diphosphokinase [Alcanivoracaceae bacterium]
MKRKSTQCYLGLGSNIGDLKQNIDVAIKKISLLEDTQLIKVASFYLTKAWGNTRQQDFINTVISIKTKLEPNALLLVLQNIENEMGRVREEKWGPRTIDIDILLYEDIVVKQPQLTIPHPYLTERSFVLVPLFELDKTLVIPNQGQLVHFVEGKSHDNDIITII